MSLTNITITNSNNVTGSTFDLKNAAYQRYYTYSDEYYPVYTLGNSQPVEWVRMSNVNGAWKMEGLAPKKRRVDPDAIPMLPKEA